MNQKNIHCFRFQLLQDICSSSIPLSYEIIKFVFSVPIKPEANLSPNPFQKKGVPNLQEQIKVICFFSSHNFQGKTKFLQHLFNEENPKASFLLFAAIICSTLEKNNANNSKIILFKILKKIENSNKRTYEILCRYHFYLGASFDSNKFTIPENFPKKRKKNICIFDFFAGSYSAARLASFVNSSNQNSIHVSAYCAIEFSAQLYKEAPTWHDLGVHSEETFLNICGDICDPVIQGQVFTFFSNLLQKKNNDPTFHIDGVLVFAGPPCNVYSQAQVANIKRIEKDIELYKQRLFSSDRMVLATLHIYSTLQALLAIQNQEKGFLPIDLIIENPFGREIFRLKKTQKAEDTQKAEVLLPWALRARFFFQPFFVENGGMLFKVETYWCSHGNLKNPQKRTMIFTTLEKFESTHCTCRANSLNTGGYFSHPKKIQKISTKKERATWPDLFLLRVLLIFDEKMQEFQDFC